jgi:hypothetical protein
MSNTSSSSSSEDSSDSEEDTVTIVVSSVELILQNVQRSKLKEALDDLERNMGTLSVDLIASGQVVIFEGKPLAVEVKSAMLQIPEKK